MLKFNKERLKEYMDSLGEMSIPARDVTVWQGHNELFRYSSGHSDAAGKVPVSDKDVYLLYSSSKLITCVGALRLVEAGKLNLSDPVYKYLPEYKNITVKDGDTVRPAKTVMTVFDLFTMCGGLSYDRNTEPIEKISKNVTASISEVVSSFVKSPLLFDPSTHFAYSFCHDVLGAIEEVVSGKRFGEYLHDEIFAPLGMDTTSFVLSEEMKKHRSEPYTYDSEKKQLVKGSDGSYFKLNKIYESGGAGIYTTVNDYIKFADALACGGTAYNGYKLLKPETVKMFGSNQLKGTPLEDFQNQTGHLGHGYGLGVSVLLDPAPRHFKCPVGTFGWGGAAGTRAFIVPSENVSIFYAQEVENVPCPPEYEKHPHNEIINIVFGGE